ncbi:hypothetical protein [Flavobacterium sp. GCM10027622]|uniref:hypothetical protein n=1 Tax=unclassified Flavobacterium TaxID=196869 RepID=UPI003610729F
MNKENPKYPVKMISESTESFATFLQEINRSEMLISFLQVGNKLISKNNGEAKEYLTGIYDHVFNTEIAKKSLTDNLDSYLDVNFYEIHLSSMVYVNTIDNFTTYLKDILAEVVQAEPQILKSNESEKLDFILGHESMKDLINAIANKKVEQLFYKGIEDIEKFFTERLKIEIFKTKEEKEGINRLIKQRNLTVHNRRKISNEFAKHFPDFNDGIGQHINFDFKYVSTINMFLYNFIGNIDEEISQKFKLKKISLLT